MPLGKINQGLFGQVLPISSFNGQLRGHKSNTWNAKAAYKTQKHGKECLQINGMAHNVISFAMQNRPFCMVKCTVF